MWFKRTQGSVEPSLRSGFYTEPWMSNTVIWDEANLYIFTWFQSMFYLVCVRVCVCAHVYGVEYNYYIKFVAPQISRCTEWRGRWGQSTLPTLALVLLLALSPAQSPSVSMFNLPYFVCVQGFPQKFWKVLSTIRCVVQWYCSACLLTTSSLCTWPNQATGQGTH